MPLPILRVYGASTTWSKPASGLIGIHVRVVGGGGGSGRANATSGGESAVSGGGGAGGYAERWYPAASLPATCTVTVGADGVGGTGPSPTGGSGTPGRGEIGRPRSDAAPSIVRAALPSRW
jgi:hypothetical protein